MLVKRLKSLQKAEAYLEPKPASTMELFTTYYFRNISSIIDIGLGYIEAFDIFKMKLSWSKSSRLFTTRSVSCCQL